MGNQNVKPSKRPAQVYPFNDNEKKSRTDWTAGVPLSPGKPAVQLSSRSRPQDEDSVTDEINISWSIPKDDGGFPITGYKIEMLDIQTNNWIEITFIEGFEPKCTLSNILYGIMYRFRVTAYNDAGPSEPGDPSDPVVIDVPGVQIAPYFVLMLNDTIALEHEKVEFRVKVLGTPKPTIQWFKDDMEVFSSDRLEIKNEEDGGSVVVRDVRLSDCGNIKCVATNILGRATSVAQLVIEAAPRLEIPENYNDGLIFRFDEVIRLKVPFIARPAARITWFFDDEPIALTEDVQIETTDTQTSLRIAAAKRWHCGEFRVLAENENGEDSAPILVTVTAPPSQPGKPVVIDIAGTTCVLRWEEIQDDGGADVKHYIVEYFRDVWDVWLKAKTTKDCQANIEDLIPGSRYKFRIKVENAYGISEASEESDAFDVGGVQLQQDSSLMMQHQKLSSPGVSNENLPASPRRKTWKEMNPTISVSADDGSSWSDVATSPPAPARGETKRLLDTKEQWESEEASEDVINNLLRVKKLSQRVSSIESDGLPSMVDVGDDNVSVMSESSDLQRARKMYADLQAMSMESTGSQENVQDLDAYAREFYNEIRALSVCTGGSIENILDNIGASCESLSSLIPQEKREELQNFEMNLKQMIEEAKMLAESPSQSMEDLKTPVREIERSRSRKSESVVSVIEFPPARMEEEEAEPEPMSRRGVPTKRSPIQQPPHQQQQIMQPPVVEDQEQLPPPPLEEMEPPPAPPSRGSSKTTPQPPGGRRVVNREPSVGSDRYEDIIVEVRKRSQSRSRMGSRTSSVVDFRNSNISLGRHEIDSSRGNSRNMGALDLETLNDASKIVAAKLADTPPVTKKLPIVEPPPKKQEVVSAPIPVRKEKSQLFAMDGNGNATAASLPTVPPRPVTPDPLVKLFPKNIPDWFMITYTYSVVLILILLVANVTPDGKLYIHFTAFWSLILYFVLEDEQSTDLLDSVVEGFLKK